MDAGGLVPGLTNDDARLILSALDMVLRYAMPFVLALFAADIGLKAFRKSDFFRFIETKAYEDWRERKKLSLPDKARDTLKLHFNVLVNALYKVEVKDVDAATAAIQYRSAEMEKILRLLPRSVKIKKQWDVFSASIDGLIDVYRTAGNKNDRRFVRLFDRARLHWLQFFNSCVDEPLNAEELERILTMGIVEGAVHDDVQHDKTDQWHSA